jgi:hypothetical protein
MNRRYVLVIQGAVSATRHAALDDAGAVCASLQVIFSGDCGSGFNGCRHEQAGFPYFLCKSNEGISWHY